MAKFKKKVKPSEQEDLKDVIPWEVDPEVTLVIDGDELAFKVASSCQETVLKYINKESLGEGLFKNKTEFYSFMSGVDFDKDLFDSELVAKAEPLPYAINTVKRRINNLCKSVKCHPDNVEIYITGKTNFRLELPLPLRYKHNRDGSDKPVLLDDLKDYLINHQGADVVEGLEADDQLTIRMSDGVREGKKIIAATVDKDATQTAGWLYNPDRGTLKYIPEGLGELYLDTETKNETVKGYGYKFLLWQCAIHDKIDGYESRDVYRQLHNGKSPKYGEKTAYKDLKDCKTFKEAIEAVCEKYKQWYGEEPFTYKDWRGEEHTVMWYELMELYFQCAYMKRKEDDKTTLISVMKKLRII